MLYISPAARHHASGYGPPPCVLPKPCAAASAPPSLFTLIAHPCAPCPRSFKYADGVLACAKHVEPGVPPGVLPSSLTIERVVFLGLPPAAAYKAKLGDGRVVDLEQGPLHPRAPTSRSTYSLPRAALPVGTDWTLAIIKA